MTAAILCPGPSLANLQALPPCDVSIAVNRAALRFACDWWAALDHPLFRAIDAQVMGSPLLLTRREDRKRHSTRAGIDTETLEAWLPHMPTRWGLFSMTAAMVLAASLGAKRIDIYGCDWAIGAADFDGHQFETNRRQEDRFALEREVYAATVNAIGVEVTRHGFTG